MKSRLQVKGQPVKGKALISHLKRLYRFERLMEWFERRRKAPDILLFILQSGMNKDTLKDRKKVEETLNALKEKDQSMTSGRFSLTKNIRHSALSSGGRTIKSVLIPILSPLRSSGNSKISTAL